MKTDHAPHSREEKSQGFLGSANGVVGLEIAFPVLYTQLVLTGKITLERLADDAPNQKNTNINTDVHYSVGFTTKELSLAHEFFWKGNDKK